MVACNYNVIDVPYSNSILAFSCLITHTKPRQTFFARVLSSSPPTRNAKHHMTHPMNLLLPLCFLVLACAVRASQGTTNVPSDWVTTASVIIQSSLSRDVDSTMLSDLVSFTYQHVQSTIPFDAQRYINAACEPANVRDYSATWTYGIMAYISESETGYVAEDMALLLDVLATRRSLISSMSIDATPAVCYIKFHTARFDPQIIQVVYDKVFASSGTPTWPHAPTITLALVYSALKTKDTKGISALGTWCQNAETVSISFLDIILPKLVWNPNLKTKTDFFYYVSNNHNAIELQIFNVLYQAVDTDLLSVAPLRTLKDNFAAFGKPFPTPVNATGLPDSYAHLTEAITDYEWLAYLKKWYDLSHFGVLSYYSTQPDELERLFSVLLQFGHDGLVPAVSHLFNHGTETNDKQIVLNVLQHVVDKNIDVLSTAGIMAFLDNLKSYNMLKFCKNDEFNTALSNLAMKTPGVLGAVMLAFTKLANYEVTFDPSLDTSLNCTIAAIALSETKTIGVPNFCSNLRKPKSSLAKYINAYIAEGNSVTADLFKPVDLVYKPDLGSSIRHPSTTETPKADALDAQELKLLNLFAKKCSQSYKLRLCGGMLVFLVLCIGSAILFRLVKRKPALDVEAAPVASDKRSS